MTASIRRTEQRDTIALGVILVAVGGGAMALQVLPGSAGIILLAIGLGLLGVFAVTRRYAALVPGSIVSGLAAGILLSEMPSVSDPLNGGLIVAGLGVGFLGIWAIGALARVPENHPWPFVPGIILTTVGIALMIGGLAIDLLQFWPLILVVGGLLVMLRATTMRRQDLETGTK